MAQSFTLKGPFITLASALKASGLADTGGQAKVIVREGQVMVNGIVEVRPGRKLVVGDRFAIQDQEWVLES